MSWDEVDVSFGEGWNPPLDKRLFTEKRPFLVDLIKKHKLKMNLVGPKGGPKNAKSLLKEILEKLYPQFINWAETMRIGGVGIVPGLVGRSRVLNRLKTHLLNHHESSSLHIGKHQKPIYLLLKKSRVTFLSKEKTNMQSIKTHGCYYACISVILVPPVSHMT